jgi:integrase
MASIREIRPGSWQAVFGVVENGRRRQRTRAFGSEAEARSFVADIERRLGRSKAPPPDPTVKELCDRFLTWCAGGRTERTTETLYSRALGLALPTLGAMRGSRVTAEHLDLLYSHLLAQGGAASQGLAPRTVRLVHRSLHRVFALAVKWKLLANNPAAEATPPMVSQSRARAAPLEGVARMIALARPDPYPQIIALALATGLRRGELCGLRWADIDTDRGTLSVNQVATIARGRYEIRPVPKTKTAQRTIGIDTGLLEVLSRWRVQLTEQMLALGIGWNVDALVFPDLRAGSAEAPRNPDVVSAMVSRFGHEAGLPEGATGLHALRHRHATGLMHLPIRMVQDRLGHSTPVITISLYQHGDDATQRATSDAAASAFGSVVQLAKRNKLSHT